MNEYKRASQVLGPIFRMFSQRLRMIEMFRPGVPLLFLSRGGIRLHHFHQLFQSTNTLEPLSRQAHFYVSRIAALRALLNRGSEYAANQIAGEFQALSAAQAMRYFLPGDVFTAWASRSENDTLISSSQPITAETLLQMSQADSPAHRDIRAHLTLQDMLLSRYFHTCTNGASEVILVDTGWSGSIFKSLQDLFPEVEFLAAFFGRYNYGKQHPAWFNSMTGLIMQHDYYNRLFPQSCFVFHRHLVESICEPAWPSVEYYLEINDVVQSASGPIPGDIIKPQAEEALARSVESYIVDNPVSSLRDSYREYNRAMEELTTIICFPTRKLARVFGVPPRSADFGRDETVPVLLEGADDELGKLERLRRSLWRQGQAALEFGIFRWPIQFLITYRMAFKRVVGKMRGFLSRFVA